MRTIKKVKLCHRESFNKNAFVCLFFKTILAFVLVTTFHISTTSAEAWNLAKNQFQINYGMYYSLPSKHFHSEHVKFDGKKLIISNDRQSYALSTDEYELTKATKRSINSYPVDLKYGFTNTLMGLGKIDIGNVEENFSFTIKNQSNKSTYMVSIPQNYQKIDSKLGLQKQIFKDEVNVFSSSLAIYPGEFRIMPEKTQFKKDTTAVELKLLYGRSFKLLIPFAQYFQDYKNKDIYSFFEFEIRNKHLFNNKRNELGLNFQLGFRPNNIWLFCFGMDNVFARYNQQHYMIPRLHQLVEDSAIFSQAANKFYNVKEKEQFITALDEKLNAYRSSKSFSYHNILSFKTLYINAEEETVGLEHYLSINQKAPFTNYTLMLKYQIDF